MHKLAKKTLLAAFTIVFAAVAIGAVTFAWFTLTSIAEVEDFDTDIKAYSGIEVSLDGITFSSNIRRDDIIKAIKDNIGDIVLNPVTTANGYSNFKTIDYSDYRGIPVLKDENNPANKWICFNLYFRTPEQGSYIYLLDDTDISSVGRPWRADAEFYDFKNSDDDSLSSMSPGDMKMIYGANALRMSFLTQDIDLGELDAGGENPVVDTMKSVVIYELDPSYGTPPKDYEKNNRLDNKIKEDYGLVDYFRMKTGGTKIINDEGGLITSGGINLKDYFNDNVLPEGVLENLNLVNANQLKDAAGGRLDSPAILKFEDDDYHEASGYYYGVIKVQMWIEGWDPDSYNTLHMADLKIKLSFGGSKREPSSESDEIDADTMFEIEYGLADVEGISGNFDHDNPSEIKKHELPLYLRPAKKDGYVFVGWFTKDSENVYTERKFIDKDFLTSIGEGPIELYARFRNYRITYILGAEGVEMGLAGEYFEDVDEWPLEIPPEEYDDGDKYKFLGWYWNKDFVGNKINESFNAVSGDITLYAKWEQIIFEVTYVFEDDFKEASNDNPLSFKRGNLPHILEDAESEGAVFLGWYLIFDNGEYSDQITEIPVDITGDITIYGKFNDIE